MPSEILLEEKGFEDTGCRFFFSLGSVVKEAGVVDTKLRKFLQD